MLAELPSPECGPGEARVSIRLAGVCGTDLQVLRGYSTFEGVLGHEGVGVVTEGPKEWVGRRVALDINLGCGECDKCRARAFKHCARRRALGIRGANGVFAEEVIVPAANLVPIPDSLPDELAVFAEPLAAAIHGASQAAPEGPVLVLGDGRLGSLTALALLAMGREVILEGRHPDRRTRLPVALRARRAGERFPTVIDTTGSPDGFRESLVCTSPQGRIVLKSTHAGESSPNLSAIVVDEISVVGSRCGDLSLALAWMADRRVDPRPLIESIEPLTPESVLKSRGRLKTLLRP